MTSYPAGYSGSVKKEVADRAIALGKAEKSKPDEPESSELAEGAISQ